MSRSPAVLNPTDEDIQMLLACQVHLGTKNATAHMEPYIFKRRPDGVNILNVGKTWEKIQMAARIIVAIENPEDIVVISARAYGQRAALKFAAQIGAKAISGRFTPGTFTNYITKGFKEPRLIIVTDPRTDNQPVNEAAYVNMPCIAFCDSDSPLKHVDVAIPGNNKGKHALGCLYWMLAREVLRLRGTLQRTQKWNVMVDMFFYRDPEEQAEKEQEVPAVKLTEEGATWDAEGPSGAAMDAAWEAGQTGAATGSWDQPAGEEWTGAAPAAEWSADAAPATTSWTA